MDEDELIEEELTGEQPQKQHKGRAEHLKAWQFKPGKSGNPSGLKPGTKSLKVFAREYLQSLDDDEKIEYMKGMDKKIIWEMAEDKPKQGMEVKADVTISDVLDKLDGSKTTDEGLAG